MLPTVLTAMGVIAAVLLGVWGIVARYDSRVRDRMDGQLGQLRDPRGRGHRLGQLRGPGDQRAQLGQLEQLGLRERMAKLEGLLEGLREAITGKRAASENDWLGGSGRELRQGALSLLAR